MNLDQLSFSQLHLPGTRRRQEDRYVILCHGLRAAEGPIVAIAVADGVGSCEHGDKAAQTAMQSVERTLATVLPMRDLIRLCLDQAHQDVRERYGGRGVTTMTLCLIADRKLVAAGAGDSRAYLSTVDRLEQVTADTVNERGELVQAIGMDAPPRFDITERSLPEDYRVVVASDGAFALDERSFLEVIRTRIASEALQTLEREVRARVKSDNVTMVLCERGQPVWPFLPQVVTRVAVRPQQVERPPRDERHAVPSAPRGTIEVHLPSFVVGVVLGAAGTFLGLNTGRQADHGGQANAILLYQQDNKTPLGPPSAYQGGSGGADGTIEAKKDSKGAKGGASTIGGATGTGSGDPNMDALSNSGGVLPGGRHGGGSAGAGGPADPNTQENDGHQGQT